MAILLEVEPTQGVTDLVTAYQDNFATLEKNKHSQKNGCDRRKLKNGQ
jgi:hypothetical protein